MCWLVGEATTPDGEARLEALVRSTDGFELAEVDLDLRGEGTIMGERQKGRNDLKLASLRRDREWVVTRPRGRHGDPRRRPRRSSSTGCSPRRSTSSSARRTPSSSSRAERAVRAQLEVALAPRGEAVPDLEALGETEGLELADVEL